MIHHDPNLYSQNLAPKVTYVTASHHPSPVHQVHHVHPAHTGHPVHHVHPAHAVHPVHPVHPVHYVTEPVVINNAGHPLVHNRAYLVTREKTHTFRSRCCRNLNETSELQLCNCTNGKCSTLHFLEWHLSAPFYCWLIGIFLALAMLTALIYFMATSPDINPAKRTITVNSQTTYRNLTVYYYIPVPCSGCTTSTSTVLYQNQVNNVYSYNRSARLLSSSKLVVLFSHLMALVVYLVM